jgi:hypothetical protein
MVKLAQVITSFSKVGSDLFKCKNKMIEQNSRYWWSKKVHQALRNCMNLDFAMNFADTLLVDK